MTEITDLPEEIPEQKNGKVTGDYNPEVEFEYIDSDVWYKFQDGDQDVAYTSDVEEALEIEEDEDLDKN